MEIVELREFDQKEIFLPSIDVEVLIKYFSKKIDLIPTFEPGKYLLKTQNHAGIIKLPSGRSILINPKIKISTLFALLARVYDPKKEIFDDQPNEYSTISGVFEFIISFFISHVEDLISRGLLRGYQNHTEYSQSIRGRILMAQTLSNRPGLYDKHWCEYRHFTPDIPENQILCWTVHVLSAWNFVDINLFARIYRLQRILSNVYLDHNARYLLDSIEFHRLNDTYKPALSLARLILDYFSFSGSQGVEPFLAFLIDMNSLFEQYITVELEDKLKTSEYKIKDKENHTLDIGKQIKLIPDILIYKNENPCLIVDAKYKLVESQNDLYQMLAYCHAVKLSQAVLVHPESETAPKNSLLIRGPGNIKISYLALNLDGGPDQLSVQSEILVNKLFEILKTVQFEDLSMVQ